YRTWWDDWDLPLYTRVLEKSITQEVLDTDAPFWRVPPLAPLRWSSLYRPWRYFSLRDVGAKVDTDRDRFQIELDVHQFLPHEVTVRRTDKYVTIEGKHEEKRDEQGYVARQFSRRYLVPIGYDANLIVSSLSSDGILTVTAPRIGLPAPKVEKYVPIWHTGKPAIEDKKLGSAFGSFFASCFLLRYTRPTSERAVRFADPNAWDMGQEMGQIAGNARGTPDDLLNAMVSVADRQLRQQQQHPGRYNRPWHIAKTQESGSTVKATADKFQINLDVQQFSPEEITVKYMDKCVVVEGKHEDKQDDHGYISRHFVRRYMLPEGHNENDIVSSLSSDGILTITCPTKIIEEKKEGRSIPIAHTGQPMKEVEEKPETKKEGEKMEP
uniref:SHSP domain-containing protein n=1 Tax=Anopheles dirus TaxID=7168 RepID=A0A182NJW1_9DIPT